MTHETQSLDYYHARPVVRVRPRLWLSHMLTAALLCLAALFVDSQLRWDWGEAQRVMQIEVVLAVYGFVCASVSLACGSLLPGDKVTVIGCLLFFAFTAFVAMLIPRVIHN